VFGSQRVSQRTSVGPRRTVPLWPAVLAAAVGVSVPALSPGLAVRGPGDRGVQDVRCPAVELDEGLNHGISDGQHCQASFTVP
jgi:hypothetical protein